MLFDIGSDDLLHVVRKRRKQCNASNGQLNRSSAAGANTKRRAMISFRGRVPVVSLMNVFYPISFFVKTGILICTGQ